MGIMSKRFIFWVKLLACVVLVGVVGWQMHGQWKVITGHPLKIEWAYMPAALGGFAGLMLTSGLVWVWMARQMGDRSPVLRLMGAYVFSQMFKYIPGKVALLLARIDRAGRVGMDARVVTLSTLLENLMYMVSGALVGAATVGFYARENTKLLLTMVAMVAGILAVCHPRVFYFVVDRALAKFKRPPVDAAHRMSMWKLLLAVFMFLPCWLFGGLAAWASVRCCGGMVGAEDLLKLPGAFAASVIGGMAVAVTPGGVGARETIMLLVLKGVTDAQALVVSVAFGRLFQVTVELTLGMIGMGLTARRGKMANDESQMANQIQSTNNE